MSSQPQTPNPRPKPKTLPPELILTTLSHLPFNNSLIPTITLSSPLLASLLQTYEISLTKSFSRSSLPHSYTDFPDSRTVPRYGYTWLISCIEKYDTIDRVMSALTTPGGNAEVVEVGERDVVSLHNFGLVNCGMLLLYRVAFLETEGEKKGFVGGLLLDSLVAMVAAVQYCVRTVRDRIAGFILRQSEGGSSENVNEVVDASVLAVRKRLELCFAEAVLSNGLEVVWEWMEDGSEDGTGRSGLEAGVLNIYHDYFGRDAEGRGIFEGPVELTGIEEGFRGLVTFGPMTEHSGKMVHILLLERVAKMMGWACKMEEVGEKVVHELAVEDHWLARLSLEGKVRLVGGSNWCENA